MKGHKGSHHRKHREEGGVVDRDDAPSMVYAGKGSNVENEADEKKHGGRAKRKHGGHVMKHMGKVEGAKEKMRMDRKPRKSGGRTGADKSPFSSARHGEDAVGHKSEEVD